MDRTVVVDGLPGSADRYVGDHAVVVVDVIRATTTAITAVALGRRCYPVASIEMALPVAARLPLPLLVGEQGGKMPCGFDITNSPAAVAARSDVWRPMILLSSSGTQLVHRASRAEHVYVACLRNLSATVRHLASRHARVAVLGAGTRGEFREEDEACCAWIAEGLIQAGFVPAGGSTRDAVRRWSGRRFDSWLHSASVDYLRRSRQLADLEFILEHVEDLDQAFAYRGGEVVEVPLETGARQPAWPVEIGA